MSNTGGLEKQKAYVLLSVPVEKINNDKDDYLQADMKRSFRQHVWVRFPSWTIYWVCRENDFVSMRSWIGYYTTSRFVTMRPDDNIRSVRSSDKKPYDEQLFYVAPSSLFESDSHSSDDDDFNSDESEDGRDSQENESEEEDEEEEEEDEEEEKEEEEEEKPKKKKINNYNVNIHIDSESVSKKQKRK